MSKSFLLSITGNEQNTINTYIHILYPHKCLSRAMNLSRFLGSIFHFFFENMKNWEDSKLQGVKIDFDGICLVFEAGKRWKVSQGVPISASTFARKPLSTQAPSQPHLVLLDIQLGCFIGRLPFLKCHWNFRMVGGKGTEKSANFQHTNLEKVMIVIAIVVKLFSEKKTYKESPNCIFGGSDPMTQPPLDIQKGLS